LYKRKESFLSLCGLLESELNFPTKGNPDFWYGEFDTFGIDDGREIKNLQTRMSVVHDRNIFVVSANFFTPEAQNSLLKVFEEPTHGTHFFIITQRADALLPTLRSRLFTISSASGVSGTSSGVDVEEFLKSGKAKRLDLIKNIIDEKDKNVAISFLNELEIVLHKEFKVLASGSISKSLEEVIECKKYLSGRAPSVKMILEHISLIVPQKKSR